MPYRLRDSRHAYGEVVRVASTAALTLTAPGATIDGISMAANDYVLVKNQASSVDNGIYIWNGAAVAMTRALDAPLPQGGRIVVSSGTINANTEWRIDNTGTITLGVTAVTFTRVSDADAWSDLQTYLSNIAASTAANTFLLSSVGAAATASSAAIAVGTGVVHLDPTTNYNYPGKTHQVRIVGTLSNWGAAQTGNFTFGLYPITAISATGVPTLGAAVGQPSAITTPANPSITTVYGAAITMPATGHYCIGVVTSATIAASSLLHLRALLQIREL